jgi:O-succinylbenzoate synthase
MNTEIEVWHYELRSGGPLNRRSGRRTVEGFLLRELGGHGCVQPWPEFGHAPVGEQLAALAAGRRTPLLDAALRCAAVDREFRAAGRSAFESMNVPDSHATIVDPETQAEAAWRAGFRVFKLKAEASVRERGRLRELVEAFPDVGLRLDFNEVPDLETFEAWWGRLGGQVRERVDFLEDPFPFDDENWPGFGMRHGVRLAADRRQALAVDGEADVRVIKPAWGEYESPSTRRSDEIVFTSAMDHPLGQAWAAWVAANAAEHDPGRVGLCGLQTHHLFEPDPFAGRLGPWRPQFHPPGGTGLGFDDLLADLPWRKV